MNKKEINILEKVFAAEIVGAVYQGENQVVKKLEKEGHVKKIEKVLGKDRFGLIRVSGYVTTLKGNYHYCYHC